MRILVRSTLALVLLGTSGCPTEPPIPLFEDTGGSSGGSGGLYEDVPLELDCSSAPATANGAEFQYTPVSSGLVEGTSYEYSASDLPSPLTLDPLTGEVAGTVDLEAGNYTFDVTIDDVTNPGEHSATAQCTLAVAPRLSAPIDTASYPCIREEGVSLTSLVANGTGDGTPIVCDFTGGNGNGRMPNGIEVDGASCTLTGTINETRYGTWTFIMRGTQSGVSVYVPFCVENDVAQGYEIFTEPHDPLEPLMGTFDPDAAFEFGEDANPRVSVIDPTACGGGASCFYRYFFVTTNAPIETYSLSPEGLLIDDKMNPQGFFHELRVSGPAVPEEFRDRPWVLSSNVAYCLTGTDGGCEDPPTQGDAAYEFGLIMFPSSD